MKLKFSSKMKRKLVESLIFTQKRFSQRQYNLLKENYEQKQKLLNQTYIVVQIDGINFKNFTQINEFNKPIDQRHVNLMNACARTMFKAYKSDMVCSYGFSDEYNFVLNKSTTLYDRKFKYIPSYYLKLSHSIYIYIYISYLFC
jgi:tRNA(His) guanylyltransferase